MSIGPLLVAVFQILATWIGHRLDPAEVQYRRLKDVRRDTLDETRDFRKALAGKDGKQAGAEFWALIERARTRV